MSNCTEFYNILSEEYDSELDVGINENNVYLFDEVCMFKNKKIKRFKRDNSYDYVNVCYDGFDRYNLCCHVYDKGKAIFKSRYADFPW